MIKMISAINAHKVISFQIMFAIQMMLLVQHIALLEYVQNVLILIILSIINVFTQH